ncbi:hypothetical protein CLOSYM_02275 [[Clostridium] symbiosum ATCC 14940]|uniref:Uncharacterized protein n=1 Tax=[Clostridium] symbiosum ATCC 14940 TaxID=411472 RepID=A0ABC9TXX6_CLOSY|nr:hypothetical protein CLOSYM_02275 [[Clostridium] symbiosum ATCC 14940]
MSITTSSFFISVQSPFIQPDGLSPKGLPVPFSVKSDYIIFFLQTLLTNQEKSIRIRKNKTVEKEE